MMVVSCNNGTLSTFVPSAENPWDISKILLVNRRLGFGIKHMDIQSKLSLTPSELIDQLIDNAKNFNDSSVSPARKENDSGSPVDQINKLFKKPAGKHNKHPRIKASIINLIALSIPEVKSILFVFILFLLAISFNKLLNSGYAVKISEVNFDLYKFKNELLNWSIFSFLSSLIFLYLLVFKNLVLLILFI